MVAVRMQILEQSRWESYLAGQLFESRQEERQAELAIAQHILLCQSEEAENAIRDMNSKSENNRLPSWGILIRRWEEIKDINYAAYLTSIKKEVREEIGEILKDHSDPR